MPDANDEFAQSVIYICSHGKDGAMGFVVNHRIKEFSFSDLAVDLPFSFQNKGLPISLYNGGPLDKTKGFILHSDEYQLPDSIKTGGGIAVSSSLEVLQDIASGKGPKQGIIALGYAGWAPEQLEKEILNNRWLIVEANKDLVFGAKDTSKWEQALSSLGIDSTNFPTAYGHS